MGTNVRTKEWGKVTSSCLSLALVLCLLFGDVHSSNARSNGGPEYISPYLDEEHARSKWARVSVPPEFLLLNSFASAKELEPVRESFWILQEGKFNFSSDAQSDVQGALGRQMFVGGTSVIPFPNDDFEYFTYVIENLRSVARSVDAELPGRAFWRDGLYLQADFFRLPLVSQAATFVHEARHGEMARIALASARAMKPVEHVLCRTGTHRGSMDCDATFNQRGAYAAELEYLVRVAVAGENFHPAYKSLSRLLALDASENFFNVAVLKTTATLAALTRDDRLLVLDSGEWFERGSLSVPGDLIRRRAQAAFLPVLPRDRSEAPWVIDVYSSAPVAGLEHFAEFLGEGELAAFNTQWSTAKKQAILGMGDHVLAGHIFEWELFSNELYFRRRGTSFWCVVQNRSDIAANGIPGDPWHFISGHSPVGVEGPFLVTESGRMNDLSETWIWFLNQECRHDQMAPLQKEFDSNWLEPDVGSSDQSVSWPRDLQVVEVVNGTEFRLWRDGRVTINGAQRSFIEQDLPEIRQIVPIYLYRNFLQ